MKALIPSATALAACLLLAAAPAQAGWRAKQTHTSPKGETREAEMFYDHHHLRIESPGEPIAIVDLKSGEFTLIDDNAKAYSVVTLDELMKLRDEMKAKMMKRLESLPEAARAQFKKQLEAQEKAMQADLDIEKTDRTDKIMGVKCRYYEWKSGQGTGEACVANDLPVDMSTFQKDAKAFAETLKKKGAGGSSAFQQTLLQLASYGFPMKSKTTMSMGPQQISNTVEVQELEKAKVAKSKFSPPKGYTKKGFKQMMMSQGGMGPGR